MASRTLKIRISGRVQMVGFRWYAKQHADTLDIRGYVRNTLRGDVEVLAEGEEKDLDTFVDYLRQGPSRARVDRLRKEELDGGSGRKSFEIST